MTTTPIAAGPNDVTVRPAAWMHDQPDRFDVIHAEAKALWLKAWPKQVEHYTIPLYRHQERQPLSTDDACALLRNVLGIDPVLDGNMLKMLRMVEQAHGILPPNAEVTGRGKRSLPKVRVDRRVGRRLSTEKEMDGRILTCVYCGHAYPQDTPAHGSQVLTDHIRVCEKHPMRKAEADIAMLRAALVGLIGVDGEDELRQMEATMRLLPAPDADKAVSINAIHALLATVPPNAGVKAAAEGSPATEGSEP